MLRVQAFVIGRTGNFYKIEARAEGVEKPFIFNIKAATEDIAAREAISRVMLLDENMAGKATWQA
jgi:hypothetical protein